MASFGRRSALACAAAAAIVRPALSQDYPSRFVKIIVGFGAGGPGDVLARLYAQQLQQLLGQPFVVENRPGASQLIAIRALMASPPDGYTIMLATGSGLVQGPGVFRDLPYDPLKDFTAIGKVASTPGVFYVNPKLPVQSLREFVAYAKAHPGELNYGSAGVGTAGHFQMEFLKHALGLQIIHVPYKSDSEVALEVSRGAIQVAMTTVQPVMPLLSSESLRALAVTGKQRLPQLPSIPSLDEAGVTQLRDLENFTFYGMVGPAGLGNDKVQKLNGAVNKIGMMPEVVKQMREILAFEAMSGTPTDLQTYITQEIPKWREVGQATGLTSSAR
jgi:tripartite-type tricarboxylate transporter receptor subunit TctC